ncbi:DUF397 domain-containing protein [Streptomyces yunnanensis]|uniref:DUF397 domain-containing protein n=1 Tax=Streptomyces yunnanensis TaxID=156453 RepID=A0ABY8A939_9ACTN|nr:DUF397 domain-containing protein [Streptomyces yunnanensis]WEB41398.1 DUF397 domain-containing protein [Streptomyces yunnanensis]
MSLKPSVGNSTELAWVKSSYSDSNEDHDCVEVAWTKSTYSGQGNGNECVEVAATPATIHIRDSKDADGPHLHVPPASWADFVAFARR